MKKLQTVMNLETGSPVGKETHPLEDKEKFKALDSHRSRVRSSMSHTMPTASTAPPEPAMADKDWGQTLTDVQLIDLLIRNKQDQVVVSRLNPHILDKRGRMFRNMSAHQRSYSGMP